MTLEARLSSPEGTEQEPIIVDEHTCVKAIDYLGREVLISGEVFIHPTTGEQVVGRVETKGNRPRLLYSYDITSISLRPKTTMEIRKTDNPDVTDVTTHKVAQGQHVLISPHVLIE